MGPGVWAGDATAGTGLGVIVEDEDAGAEEAAVFWTGAVETVWVMPSVGMQHADTTASVPPRINRFIIKCILDLILGFIIY